MRTLFAVSFKLKSTQALHSRICNPPKCTTFKEHHAPLEFLGPPSEDHAEAFTAGEGYEVAGFSFSRVSQETGHLDREEKGGGATNANGFNCIRESAVRGKEAREIIDEFDNGRERGEGF